MLESVFGGVGSNAPPAVELGVVGMTEADAQACISRTLVDHPGVGLTILARPGDVRAFLSDAGGGSLALGVAADAVVSSLGDACYASDGSSLAEVVLREAEYAGVSIALAESCTGGLVAAALTEVPGASGVFRGGVVAYSDDAKRDLLGVETSLIAAYGAVSQDVATAMAEGARTRFSADVTVAVSGIAGPAGGSVDKPVGTVCFAVADRAGSEAFRLHLPAGSRDAVRAKAVSTALDLLRRRIMSG
jgi:nicotinamide-nucleotide amidase